jgi:hypothetical protein
MQMPVFPKMKISTFTKLLYSKWYLNVQEEKVRGISKMMSVPLNTQPAGKRINADIARACI